MKFTSQINIFLFYILYSRNILANSLIENFDISTQQWTVPNILGNTSLVISGDQCVVSEDIIYVFSGNAENKMLVLNTSSLTLSTLSYDTAPAALVRYSATLLPNGDIFYIGGRFYSNFSIFGSMGMIPTFNINNSTWRTIVTSGLIPLPQAGHTATFIPQHNQILIIDGYPQGPIVSLDISTLIWSTPTVSNNGILPGLFWHTSTLFDKYILVAFGEYVDYQPISNIYLLDISQKNNYKWVSTYDPPPTSITYIASPSIHPPSSSLTSMPTYVSSPNLGLIIGLVFGGIAAVA
ncbi:11719_t:CDS:2, partial [Dentiscutata heterogama]